MKKTKKWLCLLLVFLLLPNQAFAYATKGTAQKASMEMMREDAVDVEWVLGNATLVSSEERVAALDEDGEKTFRVDTYHVVSEESSQLREKLLTGATDLSVTMYKASTYELWSEQGRAGSGSNSYEDTDASYSAVFSLTVYYSDITESGMTFRRITRVEGGYEITASRIELQAQSYEVGEMGRRYPYGGESSANREYGLSPSQTTWGASIPSSLFLGVLTSDPMAEQRVDYYYTLLRTPTGYTWSGAISVETV